MLDETKLAQAAAYLVSKRNGGRMSHLKLMKLLYLADREALRQFDTPITGDKYFAMPHGPVLSRTLDLMSGFERSAPEGWSAWLTERRNNEISVKRDSSRGSLDHLNDAEIAVLDAIFEAYGHMNRWELRDLTHDRRVVPEWEDPQGSSSPIPLERILRALGKSSEAAAAVSRDLEDHQAIDDIFAQL
ncbi:phage associated protein [Cupriavidus basilensis OR16]|uniref:Phage associated protein n=1 Tax=Cupriavidus basilensis OR16 TaxID=1127483 RepID=H1SF34_9BURK|nr:Panacea domain-containing protein [Cupriavidus basilensis]EHP38859.1 phage associated protein [Cupriavidus basilensis OR16]